MYTTFRARALSVFCAFFLFGVSALPGAFGQRVPIIGVQGVGAAGCSDGSRSEAQTIAASGRFTTPQARAFGNQALKTVPGNPPYQWPYTYTTSWTARLELRYSPSTRCAWALVSQAQEGNDVWVDRSTDGGRTWQGLLGYRRVGGGQSSTYTGVYNDAGTLMRACTNPSSAGNPVPPVCTGWY